MQIDMRKREKCEAEHVCAQLERKSERTKVEVDGIKLSMLYCGMQTDMRARLVRRTGIVSSTHRLVEVDYRCIRKLNADRHARSSC